MRIGVIAGSYSPYHIGHHKLIEIAANECNQVKVFVSTNDRIRPEQFPILGQDMKEIWARYVEPSLPNNVDVSYEGNPVRKIYEFIGKENEAGSEDTYVIFSDPSDMEHSFPKHYLERYFGDLYANGRVVLEPVQRSETVDVSGTEMRSFLDAGEKQKFVDHLPDPLKHRGEEIWTRFQESALVTPRVPRRKKQRKKR